MALFRKRQDRRQAREHQGWAGTLGAVLEPLGEGPALLDFVLRGGSDGILHRTSGRGRLAAGAARA